MSNRGEKPPAELLFATHMFMVKHNLSPADIMRILVTLDKEKAPNERRILKGGGG
jgi:hypothetical protein